MKQLHWNVNNEKIQHGLKGQCEMRDPQFMYFSLFHFNYKLLWFPFVFDLQYASKHCVYRTNKLILSMR